MIIDLHLYKRIINVASIVCRAVIYTQPEKISRHRISDRDQRPGRPIYIIESSVCGIYTIGCQALRRVIPERISLRVACLARLKNKGLAKPELPIKLSNSERAAERRGTISLSPSLSHSSRLWFHHSRHIYIANTVKITSFWFIHFDAVIECIFLKLFCLFKFGNN